MTAALTPLRGKRITWTTLLGLLLVPLTIAGLFVWGLWNPTERLGNVTAAVVNLDEPVTIDGQIVPLGRVLAGELISGGAPGNGATDDDASGSTANDARQNFTWVLTDEADAREGLASGKYATTVTIPKNFSAASTSLAGGPSEARVATIEITESEQGRLLDSALSSIVTQTATRVLNQQLGEQFVGSVFVGMTSLHDGISEAADGAHQLADGGTQLTDGMEAFAEGVGQLSAGTQQLADGASALSSGAQELAGGADGLAQGANELAIGAREAAVGGSQLADGVAQYTGGVNAILEPIIGITGQSIEPLKQVRAIIETLPDEMFPAETPKLEVLAQIDAVIAELESASQGSDESQLIQLRDAGIALAEGTRASANGQAELATGLEGYSGGMSQFAGGVQTFAEGVSAFGSGVSTLAAQTPELAAGATGLAEGTAASAEGARALAEGLDTAAAGIPNYTEDERQIMASTAIEGVTSEGASDELFNASGVPLFAGIALWAGALAAFLVIAPLWSRTRTAARGVFAITLRSALPAVLLGAGQGALAGIVLPLMLGYDFSQAASFFGFAVLAGVSFSLIMQGLSARMGGLGRFIAFGLLVVAFVVGIVSTVPGALAAIGDASPIGAAFAGFQAIAAGADGGPAGTATLLLVVWGVAGLALTAWAVARARRPEPVG